MSSEDGYLHQELSYEVLGCAFAAFKTVGVGFDEIRYHKIFHDYLLKKGFKADYKQPAYLDYLGERIANFEIDEVVENELIVELKGIQTAFIPENYAQIMTYLKVKGLRLGLLINFGLHKAYPERIIFDERRKHDFEQWDDDYFQLSSPKKFIDAVIASIRQVDKILGVAYHSKIYQAAMAIELRQNQLVYDDQVRIDIEIENIKFAPFEIDYWLVEKTLLLGILAGKEKPRVYDLIRMRTYLKRLKIHYGLVAYWSTKNLQLFGVYES